MKSKPVNEFFLQVFLVRKISGPDSGSLYAMKVLKKATLKGDYLMLWKSSKKLLKRDLLWKQRLQVKI